MSSGLAILQPTADDISKLVMAKAHLGTKNVDFQMSKYVYKRRNDGVYVLNLHKTWEKIVLAARIIAAVPDPADVCVISAPVYGQRAILKFAKFTGATPMAGRATPGIFTNQIQATYREPRVLVVTDPRVDHQPVREASYVNIPIIALCNTDSPLRYVDVAIPCNNKGEHAVGLVWWMLCREVLRLRGSISRSVPWEIMVDLFFYRKPEDIEAEEAAEEQGVEAITAPQWESAPVDAPVGMSGQQVDWSASADAGAIPQMQAIGTATFGSTVTTATEDWGSAGQQWQSSAAEWGNEQ